jgi:acyl-CoA hydrolase
MTTWQQARSPRTDASPHHLVDVPADWAQGRACFGGLVAAYALDALARHPETSAPTRSVMVDFMAPLSPGPARVESQVLRAGRTLTHARAEVWQGERHCASVTQITGPRRDTKVDWAPPAMPDVPSPAQLTTQPYRPGRLPAFLQHFDHRWTTRHAPFTGADTPVVGGWLRHKHPGPTDAAAILALIDAWPPPVLVLLNEHAAASTVTWHVTLVQPPPVQPIDDWWFFRGEAVTAAGGHVDMQGTLYTRDGTLIARSTQLTAEFS